MGSDPGQASPEKGEKIVRLAVQALVADLELPITPNFTNCPTLFQGVSAKGDAVCKLPRFRETLPGGKSYDVLDQGLTPQDNTEVYHVPAGHVFLMGDNRDDSADSRTRLLIRDGVINSRERDQLGWYVPAENLVGRAEFIFFSHDPSAAGWTEPWKWPASIRFSRFFMAIH